MTEMTDEEDQEFDARLRFALEGILADADPGVVARLKPGMNLRPSEGGFEVYMLDQADEEVVLGRLTPEDLQPVWIAATPKDPANPPKQNRLIELVMEAVLAFDQAGRERWVNALNAGQVEFGQMWLDGETFSKNDQGEFVSDPNGEFQKVPDVKAWLVDGIEPQSSIRIPSGMLGKYVPVEEPPDAEIIPLRPDDEDPSPS